MLKQHPLGKLLPAMNAEEYEYAKADIQKYGQRDAIILLDGQVLDGWHRYRICLDLGIEPKVKTLAKKADALAEVISRNLARRQLSPGQRYGVLLQIAEQFPTERRRARLQPFQQVVRKSRTQFEVRVFEGLLRGRRVRGYVAAVRLGGSSVQEFGE